VARCFLLRVFPRMPYSNIGSLCYTQLPFIGRRGGGGGATFFSGAKGAGAGPWEAALVYSSSSDDDGEHDNGVIGVESKGLAGA
jgi:hypothetical protein